MITTVQCLLIVGALCGGGLAFDLFEKNNNVGGTVSGILALIGLAGVIAIELLIKR